MSGVKSGSTGTPMGSVVMSPAKAKRAAKRRRAEEKRWKSLNGPVVVTYRDGHEKGTLNPPKV